MSISMGMDLLPQQQLRASPTLIALNNTLALSSAELHQLVQQELEENPALEQLEGQDTTCEVCGRALYQGVCLRCLQNLAPERDDDYEAPGDAQEREFDPLMSVAAPLTLLESLQRDLHISLPVADHPIVNYLIGSLDERGMLEGDLETIAETLGVSPERVELVLRRLQDLAPPGVGARSTQECLLLQIDYLARTGVAHSHARTIIASHWDDFAAHRFTELARILGLSYDAIVGVRDFIRQYLNPFPLSADRHEGPRTIAVLVPDVIIIDEGDRFIVEPAESWRYRLRLNPLYQQLAHAVAQGTQEVSNSEMDHLRTFVNRAQFFMRNLRYRRETICRITECIVARQEAFLRHGIRHLAPLTRADVAADLGLHESTVSRATAHKYVRLPNHEIIPFSHFFSASLSVKDVIQELVAGEKSPLTDEEIVAQLRDRGINIARRTVAKYRNQLGIPPSSVR